MARSAVTRRYAFNCGSIFAIWLRNSRVKSTGDSARRSISLDASAMVRKCGSPFMCVHHVFRLSERFSRLAAGQSTCGALPDGAGAHGPGHPAYDSVPVRRHGRARNGVRLCLGARTARIAAGRPRPASPTEASIMRRRTYIRCRRGSAAPHANRTAGCGRNPQMLESRCRTTRFARPESPPSFWKRHNLAERSELQGLKEIIHE
jgi:hypothetical protein